MGNPQALPHPCCRRRPPAAEQTAHAASSAKPMRLTRRARPADPAVGRRRRDGAGAPALRARAPGPAPPAAWPPLSALSPGKGPAMSDPSDPASEGPQIIGATSEELPSWTREVSHVIAFDVRDGERPTGTGEINARRV